MKKSSKIAVYTISFILLAVIFVLSNGSNYVVLSKINTAIPQTYGAITNIGNGFISVNQSGSPNINASLPSGYKDYFSFFIADIGANGLGEYLTSGAVFYYYNNNDAKTSIPNNDYFFNFYKEQIVSGYGQYMASAFENNTFINTLYSKNNKSIVSFGENGVSGTLYFFATNNSYENANETNGYKSYFNSTALPISANQTFIVSARIVNRTFTEPNPNYAQCKYSIVNNLNGGSGYLLTSDFWICKALTTTTLNLTSFNSTDAVILIETPQTLSFKSIFSYVSPLGAIPSCEYDYGYDPIVSINKTTLTAYPSGYTNYSYTGLSLSYANALTTLKIAPYTTFNYITFASNSSIIYANLLANFDNNIRFLNTNSTIIAKTGMINNSLNVQNPYFSPLTTSDQNKIFSFNTSPEANKLLNTTFADFSLFGFYITASEGSSETYTEININSTNSSYYAPLKVNLTLAVFTNLYAPSVNVQTINMSLIPRSIILNKTNYVNAYDKIELNGVNYTESGFNSEINFSEKIDKTASVYTDQFGNAFNVSVPITIYVFVNTTHLRGNFNASFGFVPSIKYVNYSIADGEFYVSTLNKLPINLSFKSTSSNILTNGVKSTSFLYQNTSEVPYLTWTYSGFGSIPVQISAKLNNFIWTQNTIFEFDGVNYTTSSPDLAISLNGSTIYNFYAYFLYNGKNEKVPYSIQTDAFNPCESTQNIQFAYVSTNITSDGSIFKSITTCSGNGNCSQTEQNTTNSTLGSSGFSFKGSNTAFGKSYFSIGIASFVFTNDFLFLLLGLALFVYLISKSRHDILMPYVVFTLIMVIGYAVNLVEPFIFVLFMLILSVVLALTFRDLLSKRNGS
jgi:hypothetical protein